MNRAPTIRGNGGNMAETKIPELNYLLKKVEQRYGRRISTSTDFEALSVVIDHKTGELVSASTLKRLWGYVSMRPTPRITSIGHSLQVSGHEGFPDILQESEELVLLPVHFFLQLHFIFRRSEKRPDCHHQMEPGQSGHTRISRKRRIRGKEVTELTTS